MSGLTKAGGQKLIDKHEELQILIAQLTETLRLTNLYMSRLVGEDLTEQDLGTE